MDVRTFGCQKCTISYDRPSAAELVRTGDVLVVVRSDVLEG
jgi:hypothetical protein